MRPLPLGFALGTFSTNCTQQKGGCLYIYVHIYIREKAKEFVI